jgi:hypothetical protein
MYLSIHQKAFENISELRKELNLVLSDDNLYFYQMYVNKQLFCIAYGIEHEGKLIYSITFNKWSLLKTSNVSATQLEMLLCNFITKLIAESKSRGIKTPIEFQIDLECEFMLFENFGFLQSGPLKLKDTNSLGINARVLTN